MHNSDSQLQKRDEAWDELRHAAYTWMVWVNKYCHVGVFNMKPVNNFRDFRNSLNKNFKLKSGNTRISSTHFEGGEKMNRNHPPSIFSWNKEHSKRRTVSRLSQGEIVKRANSEGRPEFKEILSTRNDTGNIVLHPESSVNHSIDQCLQFG